MIIMSRFFVKALGSVMAHELDRRALLGLHAANREMRWEELRRTVGEKSPQLFAYAMERLMSNALVNRRLRPQGKRYKSILSTSGRGALIAAILESLSRSGRLPSELPEDVAEDVRAFFAPRIPKLQTPVPEGRG